MSQIYVSNLTFGYEGSFDNIFENVSFSLDTDWKLGFAGRNGKGKTTFLKLLLGEYSYQGSITTSTCFDYFPYSIRKENRSKPAVEFFEELKPGSEQWRVFCEMDKLGLEGDLLYGDLIPLALESRQSFFWQCFFPEKMIFCFWTSPLITWIRNPGKW